MDHGRKTPALWYADSEQEDKEGTPSLAETQSSFGSGVTRAFVSLSDKSKLALLGSGLQSLGYTIVSTGGTATALDNAVTSPGGVSFEEGIKNIDIGGFTMIRAAAKNHKDDCWNLKSDQVDQQFCRKLAWEAFRHVAAYDSAVSEWLWKQTGGDKFPPSYTRLLSLKSSLRYVENPLQNAAFYEDKSLAEVNAGSIATAIQHHGKEMSYNNYLDAYKPQWSILASRDDILGAGRLAVKADPVSAFAGIVAFSVEVDKALAKEIWEFRSPTDGETRMFYEIVVALKYSQKGLEVLHGRSKTLRILEAKKNEKGKLPL
ncbi:hypothetical protein Cgig2_025064 [Carnegiea gigantea]|uniref:MGS-like domain-containing protein n=1 Tax=Carnegiea gigantea TaxID=171969 RepID=A0A9Q1JQQ1_9CARY|nr:hypothetical protein Cgig2_025064 [Carnegiea gigantea]